MELLVDVSIEPRRLEGAVHVLRVERRRRNYSCQQLERRLKNAFKLLGTFLRLREFAWRVRLSAMPVVQSPAQIGDDPSDVKTAPFRDKALNLISRGHATTGTEPIRDSRRDDCRDGVRSTASPAKILPCDSPNTLYFRARVRQPSEFRNARM